MKKRLLFALMSLLFVVGVNTANAITFNVTYEEGGVTKTVEDGAICYVPNGTVVNVAWEGAPSISMYQPSYAVYTEATSFTVTGSANSRIGLFLVENDSNGSPSGAAFMADFYVTSTVNFAQLPTVTWTEDGSPMSATYGGSYELPVGTEVTVSSQYANSIYAVEIDGSGQKIDDMLPDNPYTFAVTSGEHRWTFQGQNDYGQSDKFYVTFVGEEEAAAPAFVVTWNDGSGVVTGENGGTYTLPVGTEITATLDGATYLSVSQDDIPIENANSSSISFTPVTGTHVYSVSGRVDGTDVVFSATFTVEAAAEPEGLQVKWTVDGVESSAVDGGTYTIPAGTVVTASYPDYTLQVYLPGGTTVNGLNSITFTPTEESYTYTIYAIKGADVSYITVTFKVEAAAEPTLEVKWTENGTEKFAENEGSYTIPAGTVVTVSYPEATVQVNGSAGVIANGLNSVTFTPAAGTNSYTIYAMPSGSPVSYITVTFTVEEEPATLQVKWTVGGVESSAVNGGSYTIPAGTVVTASYPGANLQVNNSGGYLLGGKDSVTFTPTAGTEKYTIYAMPSGGGVMYWDVTFTVESAGPEMTVSWNDNYGVSVTATEGETYTVAAGTTITATYSADDVVSMNIELDGAAAFWKTVSGNTVTFVPQSGTHVYNFLARIGSMYTSDYKVTFVVEGGSTEDGIKVTWTEDGVECSAENGGSYEVPVGTVITASYPNAGYMSVDRANADDTGLEWDWISPTDGTSISFSIENTNSYKYIIAHDYKFGADEAFTVYFTGVEAPAEPSVEVRWSVDGNEFTATAGACYTVPEGTEVTASYPGAYWLCIDLDTRGWKEDYAESITFTVENGDHLYSVSGLDSNYKGIPSFDVTFATVPATQMVVTWTSDGTTVEAVNGESYSVLKDTEVTAVSADAVKMLVYLDNSDVAWQVAEDDNITFTVESGRHVYTIKSEDASLTLSDPFVITITDDATVGIEGITLGANGVGVVNGMVVAPAGSRLFTVSGVELPMGRSHGAGYYIVVTPTGASMKVAVK